MKYTAMVLSNISEVRYHEGTETVEMLFRNERMHQHFDVASRVYQRLRGADSYGQYLNQESKDRLGTSGS